MKYLLIYLFTGCSNVKKTKILKIENNNAKNINVRDTLKIKEVIIDTNTIDSLQIGVTFYKYNAFNGFKLIETEPYEFIELNKKSNSTQVMIYSKAKKYYAVLVSAEDIVDKYDYNWEILKKTVEDIVFFDTEFKICWYLYDGNYPPKGRFGIGENINQTKIINEHFDCEIYNKYKVFDVDYNKGKIIEINKKESTFCCSDGY